MSTAKFDNGVFGNADRTKGDYVRRRVSKLLCAEREVEIEMIN